MALAGTVVFAQEGKTLYQLPEKNALGTEKIVGEDAFLVGSDDGLFRVTSNNDAFPLWTESRVDQLLKLNLSGEDGTPFTAWMLRTKKGIYYTEDFKKYDERDKDLPFLTIKKYDGNQATLEKQIQTIKDIGVNPFNNYQIVTATKDNVYYSKDCGKTWKNLGSMSGNTSGIKAVAVATINGETVVFMAHPIFGLSYIHPDYSNPQWTDITAGFESMQSLTSPDEISDILPVIRTSSLGEQFIEVYISQSYIPRIYKLNWEDKRGELIYKGAEPVEAIDGLTTMDNVLVYTKLEGIGAIDLNSYTNPGTPVRFNDWNKAFAAVPGMINTAWIPVSRSGFSKGILLNELWLLYPGTLNSPYAEIADGKKAIYASAYQCRNQAGIDKFKKAITSRNMNAVVIDMKDDYGLLRYDSKDPEILEKGAVSSYAVDLDSFIEQYKKEGIYLIARIVTFKDKTLTKYKNGKYAVWDTSANKPWMGKKPAENVLDEDGNPTGEKIINYYDENWCDPYSEEVWEYNVRIAKELISRGFDEIQFDYIRFPTDGTNLRNATYRWKSEGMDKESALISFLSYARENIDAPIGIDIYGANGWYRSGTRTGQDAEMLAEYVDVIGPMFYPSHFEQSFLNYPPLAERTYRIYYYGTFRNTVICRNRALIRPWIQSFYMGVSYDKVYYDENYIKKEFFGVRDSVNHGYMCWNNSGEYGVTPADVTDFEPYIGTAPEASDLFKKPAIGTTRKPVYVRDLDLSILDSILHPYYEEDLERGIQYKPFLQTPGFN